MNQKVDLLINTNVELMNQNINSMNQKINALNEKLDSMKQYFEDGLRFNIKSMDKGWTIKYNRYMVEIMHPGLGHFGNGYISQFTLPKELVPTIDKKFLCYSWPGGEKGDGDWCHVFINTNGVVSVYFRMNSLPVSCIYTL